MKFTCTNLRKTETLGYESDVLKFGKNELKAKRVYFFPASLTEEHAQLFVLVDGLFQKKSVLHLKSQSWLAGIEDDTEDQVAVDALNFDVQECMKDMTSCEKDLTLPSRVHKTTHMSPTIFREGEILSAEGLYYRESKDIDVIFCERVTSYTKTFDLTVVLKNGKVETHSCMDRKSLKQLEEWASKNTIEFYQTGPDPLPWKQMFSYHKDQSWKEINDLLNHVSSDEDEGSDWEAGETDPEDDDLDDFIDSDEEEIDYPSESESESEYEDEDEDYAIVVKSKRVLSDSEDEQPVKRMKC